MARDRVLVVDDEPGMRRMLEVMLRRVGLDVELCVDGKAALARIADAPPYALVLTDLVMPDVGGLEVLSKAKAKDLSTEVIVITAYATTEAAVEAMRRGAYDYIQKPFSVEEMKATIDKALEKHYLRRENVALRRKVSGQYQLGDLIGRSVAMQKVFDLVRRVAGTQSNVLLTGESGTGKELVARAIHTLSSQPGSGRADGPFVAVNCGAIPATLMEAELFGHVKGAFTGAAQARDGLFRAAHGGTLFLDEVSEIPRPLQVTLLRVLQERRIRPVGSNVEHEVDVRIIAASNRDLETMVQKGEFREDLFYRLNVIRVPLPPLRERREDVGLLAEAFVERFARAQGKPVPKLSPGALRRLGSLPLMGNVRELENLMERAVTLTPGSVIEEDALGPSGVSPDVELPAGGADLEAVLAETEKRMLVAALAKSDGVQTQAAKLLGISFRSMRYRLRKHGLVEGQADEVDSDDAEGQSG
jgi:two-component system response regulator PilR (NtrC family)